MKLIIDIEDYDKKWVTNGYYIPNEINGKIAETIINGIPLDDITSEIREEKEFAYADFEQYKVDYLGCDAEYIEDELPNDDYRYGMERCLEIIYNHIGERSE